MADSATAVDTPVAVPKPESKSADAATRMVFVGLGLVEGFTKVCYPPASNTVIFVVMALVLLIKPAGLFGQTK